MIKRPSLRAVPGELARAKIKAMVIEHLDDIVDRYARGESLQTIGASLPTPIQGARLRTILINTDETHAAYANAYVERSHQLVEEALELGKKAGKLGDAAGYKVNVDVNMKVAAKINPQAYGEASKVELTGRGGGPLEVKADVTLTPAEAYERLVKGK
jgi:hypothetical protein